jgi:hypothetical protein
MFMKFAAHNPENHILWQNSGQGGNHLLISAETKLYFKPQDH